MKTRNQKFTVYEPGDEIPDRVKDLATQREAEHLDPSEVSEGIFGYSDSEGMRAELLAVGVRLDVGKGDGPYWSIGSPGEGVALTGRVVDLPKFLAHVGIDGKEAKRLAWFDGLGGISLTMRKSRGHYENTSADSAFDGPPHRPGAEELCSAIQHLSDEWEDFVKNTAHDALRRIRAEYEYRHDFERILERCRDLGEGIDETGRLVSLEDCE